MTIREMIETGRMKVGDYIDYKPDIETFQSNPACTGFNEVQVLKTSTKEVYILWYYDKEQNIAQITTRWSVNPITLSGIVGYFNGPDELHRLCETNYSSKRLGLKARCMTEEDYVQKFECKRPSDPVRIAFCYEGPYEGYNSFNGNEYLRVHSPRDNRFYSADGGGIVKKDEHGFEYRVPTLNNPVFLTESYFYNRHSIGYGDIFGYCWLASRCFHLIGNEVMYSIHYLTTVSKGGPILYYSNQRAVTPTFGVHPIITLDGNVCIDEQNKIGKKWRIMD